MKSEEEAVPMDGPLQWWKEALQGTQPAMVQRRDALPPCGESGGLGADNLGTLESVKREKN